MKIVVLNYSGNVGKSTISQELLAPRIPAPVYAVETINSDGTDSQGIKGREFAQLHEELLAEFQNIFAGRGLEDLPSPVAYDSERKL